MALRVESPSKYDRWIENWLANSKGWVAGRCYEASKEMVEAFPELKLVGGHAFDNKGFRCEHYWCTAPDGSIVDPTAAQFYHGVKSYEPFKPGDEVKIGRCMNCGDKIYGTVQSLDDNDPKLLYGAISRYACSKGCNDEFLESLKQ